MHGLCPMMLYDTLPLSCSTKTYAWSVPNDAVWYILSLLQNQDLCMVCAQWCFIIPFLSPAQPRLNHDLCPMMLYDTFPLSCSTKTYAWPVSNNDAVWYLPLSCSTKTYAWSVPNDAVWYLLSLLLNQDLCMVCAQWCFIIPSLSPAQPRLNAWSVPNDAVWYLPSLLLNQDLCNDAVTFPLSCQIMMLYDTFSHSCSTKTYAWSVPNDAVWYLSSLLLNKDLCMVCAQWCCMIPSLSPAQPRLMHGLCPMMLYHTSPLSCSTKTYAWSVPNDAVWYLPSLLLNQDLSMVCAQWCCIIPSLSPAQPRLLHGLCPMMLYDTFLFSCSTKTYVWSVPNNAVSYLPSLLLNQDLCMVCTQWCCTIPFLSPALPRLMHGLCPMMLYNTFPLSCSTKTYEWSVPNDAVWYLPSLLINQDLCMVCAQWCCMIPFLSPAQPRLMHGLCPMMLHDTFPLSCSTETYAWSVPNDAVRYISSLLHYQHLCMVCAQWCCNYLPSLLLNQDLCMICAQWCCMIPSLSPA